MKSFKVKVKSLFKYSCFILGSVIIAGTISLLFFCALRLIVDPCDLQAVAAIFGGLTTLIGVLITISDLEKQRKNDKLEADKQLKEDKRLFCLPILQYTIDTDEKSLNGSVYRLNDDPNDLYKKIQVNITVKNIGLKLAQNILFQYIVNCEDYGKSGTVNEIIEPGAFISHTAYIEIPLSEYENAYYHRSLTVLVLYDDIYGNHYVQELNGEISTSISTDDAGNEDKHIFVSLSPDTYQIVTENFEYEIPPEKIEAEKNRVEMERREIEFSKIPERNTIDNLVSSYCAGGPFFGEVIHQVYPQLFFEGGGGGSVDYKKIADAIFYVTTCETYSNESGFYAEYRPIYCVNLFLGTVVRVDYKLKVSGLPGSMIQKRQFRKQVKNLP